MQRNYYAIIPANVRYDKNLKDKAKLLYGEITALCNEKGYCWASNRYFAELYSVSIKTISTLIKNLIDNGYIYSEIIYKNGSKEIDKRYLKLTNNPIENIVNTPMEEKVNTPMEEKVNTPMEEKVKDNNTVINNTIINNKKEKREKTNSKNNKSEIDMLIEEYTNNTELKNTLIEFVKHRKSLKAPMTTRALKQLMNKLNSLATNDSVKIEILNESILNGWKGVFPLKNDWAPINKYRGGFNNEPRCNTSKNYEPSKGKSKEDEHDAEYWEEQNRILNEGIDF